MAFSFKKAGMSSKGQSIRDGEPRPLSHLHNNSLYILMHTRSQVAGQYHWMLYLHENNEAGGKRYRFKGMWEANDSEQDQGTTKWIADPEKTKGAMSSSLLIGALKVAENCRLAVVDPIITAEDTKLNEIEGLDSRVYVLRALERLKKHGAMSFSDINNVEQEAVNFANSHHASCISSNPQPRALDFSRVCGMTRV